MTDTLFKVYVGLVALLLVALVVRRIFDAIEDKRKAEHNWRAWMESARNEFGDQPHLAEDVRRRLNDGDAT